MRKSMNRPLVEALNPSKKRGEGAAEPFEAFAARYREYLASTKYWRQRRKAAAESVAGNNADSEAKP